MPAAINLVVKNNALVDKTFTLNSPASGDGGVAEWVLKEGLISSVFPRLTASAVKTQNASRKVSIRFRLPSSFTDTNTNLPKVGAAFEFNGTASVPDDFPESLKDDAVAYTANIIAHALIKSMVRDGLPAT